MDFDYMLEKKNSQPQWMYEMKKLKTLRSAFAIITPTVALCYLFTVNVIKVDMNPNRRPAISQNMEKQADSPNQKYWYSSLEQKKETIIANK